jgi:hypothetical protein
VSKIFNQFHVKIVVFKKNSKIEFSISTTTTTVGVSYQQLHSLLTEVREPDVFFARLGGKTAPENLVKNIQRVFEGTGGLIDIVCYVEPW